MFNINDLTLGQVKELGKLFNQSGVSKLTVEEDWGTQIVILQRGWVAVGKVTKNGDYFTIDNASIIRRWGTTKGLGQLATEGKLSNTELEPTPRMRFQELTVISFIKCDESKWSK
jgi:hypothetical protein